MLVTLSDIFTLVSASQCLNAPSPILVTLLGMVTLVSDEQSENAYSPMLLTPRSMTTDFTCKQTLFHGTQLL